MFLNVAVGKTISLVLWHNCIDDSQMWLTFQNFSKLKLSSQNKQVICLEQFPSSACRVST